MQTKLKGKIYGAVEKSFAGKKIAVAFSGGLDSSVLAKVCKDLGKDVTLLTIGFSNSTDIKSAKEVAEHLKLPLITGILDIEKLGEDLKTVFSMAKINNLLELEIATAFYCIFRLAAEHKLNIVLTASGIDAMFCGFDKYKAVLKDGEEAVQRAVKEEVNHALANEIVYEEIADKFGVKTIAPFLGKGFVEFALKIPVEKKIKSTRDEKRKLIWRKVAIDIGLPKKLAMTTKKSLQYSTKIDAAVEKLARRYGLTKEMAKKAGFVGVKEMYFKTILKRE